MPIIGGGIAAPNVALAHAVDEAGELYGKASKLESVGRIAKPSRSSSAR